MNNKSYCRKYTKSSNSNFYYSFIFLPRKKREAIFNVYAFSRLIDDIIDEGKDKNDMATKLAEVGDQLALAYNGRPKNLILKALSETVHNYDIPKIYFDDLIRGVEMDLNKDRYKTFDELETYCYHVASAVGLICIEIFGYNNVRTREYAINLGKALQLTNILRDLKEDAERGRIYLPQEDLDSFGYSEEGLLKSTYDESFKSLMKFQVRRAESFYKKAFDLLPPEDLSTMYAAQVMGKIYHRLLDKIVASKYDIFGQQIQIATTQKLLTAFGTFAKCKLWRN